METIRYGLIGAQDIRVGTGTFEVELADGRIVTLNEFSGVTAPNLMILPAYPLASLPPAAAATAGQLARVTDNIRGIWKYTGTAWVSVTGYADSGDFGVVPGVFDAATTAANRAGIQAMLDVGESTVLHFPTGTIEVDKPLDGTDRHQRTFIGSGKYNGTTIRGRFSGGDVGKPVLDLTGATNWTFRDMSVTGIGTAPNLPGTDLLLARSTTNPNSNGHSFYNMAFGGSVTLASLIMTGAEDMRFFNVDVGTDQTAASAHLYMGALNTIGATSAFRTISPSGNGNVGTFVGGTIGNGASPAGVPVLWIDEAYSVRFLGSFFAVGLTTGTTGDVRITATATNRNLKFDTIHVEGSTTNFIRIQSGGVVGLVMENCSVVASNALILGDAGTTLTNLKLFGEDAGNTSLFAVDIPTLNDSIVHASNKPVRVTTASTRNQFFDVSVLTLPAGTAGSSRTVANRFFLGGPTTASGNDAPAGFQNVRKNQVDLNFGTVAANSVATQTVTVTGVVTDNTWMATATPISTLPAGLVWSAFVSAADVVTVRVANPTGAGIVDAARGWVIVAFQI